METKSVKTRPYLVIATSTHVVYATHYYVDLDKAQDKFAELIATLPNYVEVSLVDTTTFPGITIKTTRPE